MRIKLHRLILIAVLAALGGPPPARAAFEDLGVSARALGMGDAFTAVADDVYDIYYNPAGLATLDQPQLGVAYSKLFPGLTDNSNLQNSFVGYENPIGNDGRWGTVGFAWNNFDLAGLYQENSAYASYGDAIIPGKLYGGGSLKYLERSLNAGSLASNALSPTGIATGQPDSVLQHSSEYTADADLGLLYRILPRWRLGAEIQHLFAPNIAFDPAQSDLLGRNYNLGVAYKTPFTTLTGEYDIVADPGGWTDEIGTLAGEKWLPTLMDGTFGVRGSIALGNRSYSQATAGISYKINKLEFDYAFAMQLSGLTLGETGGSQYLDMTVRFGRSKKAAPLFREAMIENMPELASISTPEFRYQEAAAGRYAGAAVREFLKEARTAAVAGRFGEAQERVGQALALKSADATIRSDYARLKTVSAFYPDIEGFTNDPARAAIYDGILNFLDGKDRRALQDISYAANLDPSSAKLIALKNAMESAAQAALPRQAAAVLPARIPAPPAASAASPVAVSPAPPPAPAPAVVPAPVAVSAPASKASEVASDSAILEMALRRGDYDRAIEAGRRLAKSHPNSLVYRRLGIAYAGRMDYDEALKALRLAYSLEANPKIRSKLRFYIEALVPIIEEGHRSGLAAKALSPEEIEQLYQNGVELYSQGKLRDAEKAFKAVIEADRRNMPARRALKRIQTELLEQGQ